MNIKERELDVSEDTHPVVEQMEKEWPKMTKEFKRLQREQYELFCRKQHDYGHVHPHTLLPFVVEHAGALGKEAMGLFFSYRKKAKYINKENGLPASVNGISTWSSRGFTNWFMQSFSVANLKGQGHFIATAANVIRASGN